MDPRQVLRERKVFQVLTVKIDLSLGQHTYFSPSNLGWKEANRIISSVPGFSVQWFLSTTATPALHGPWTSASTFLSLSLFSFRSWTVVSAWTGLSKPPKTKTHSRYSEGILVRGVQTRCHHCCQALGEGQHEYCWHTPHSAVLTLGRTSEEFRSRKSRRSMGKKHK